jgi:hypothetical protein
MALKRLLARDPATIARVPGLLDAVFPHLVPGVVVSLNNRKSEVPGCEAIPQEMVARSTLQRAMLFEVAVAAAEQIAEGRASVDWAVCLDVAVKRQQNHFDAAIAKELSDIDKEVSVLVARNLIKMLEYLQSELGGAMVQRAPVIPGYQWIASGVGDFAVGTTLIEVKCTNRKFVSADYRQILMYWLLSYSAAIESGTQEWSHGVLMNPRLNLMIRFSFKDIVDLIAGGRSKVDLLEILSVVIGERWSQA